MQKCLFVFRKNDVIVSVNNIPCENVKHEVAVEARKFIFQNPKKSKQLFSVKNSGSVVRLVSFINMNFNKSNF
jgi:iron uptake system EfeUOB component EfeO/EfeM